MYTTSFLDGLLHVLINYFFLYLLLQYVYAVIKGNAALCFSCIMQNASLLGLHLFRRLSQDIVYRGHTGSAEVAHMQYCLAQQQSCRVEGERIAFESQDRPVVLMKIAISCVTSGRGLHHPIGLCKMYGSGMCGRLNGKEFA